MSSRKYLVGLAVAVLVILLVSSFLRVYGRDGFLDLEAMKAAVVSLQAEKKQPCKGPNC